VTILSQPARTCMSLRRKQLGHIVSAPNIKNIKPPTGPAYHAASLLTFSKRTRKTVPCNTVRAVSRRLFFTAKDRMRSAPYEQLGKAPIRRSFNIERESYFFHRSQEVS